MRAINLVSALCFRRREFLPPFRNKKGLIFSRSPRIRIFLSLMLSVVRGIHFGIALKAESTTTTVFAMQPAAKDNIYGPQFFIF